MIVLNLLMNQKFISQGRALDTISQQWKHLEQTVMNR